VSGLSVWSGGDYPTQCPGWRVPFPIRDPAVSHTGTPPASPAGRSTSTAATRGGGGVTTLPGEPPPAGTELTSAEARP